MFDRATGHRAAEDVKADAPKKFQDVFGDTLLQLAESDPRIVAITAAMPSGTSVSTMQSVYPDRVFDVGISEGHAVTFAGGLAKDGMKPFVAIYSSFLQRGYDHIIHDVALNNLPVTFCIDRAGLVGEDGATHHGAFDLSYLRTIPGMIIGAPRNGEILRDMMYTAATTDHGPFAIRYPRGGKLTDGDTPMKEIEVGKGEQLRHGTDAILLTIGTTADDATQAAFEASQANISVAHYDVRFLKPLDENLLREVAQTGLPIITVEDGTLKGGFGSAVAEWMAENGYTPSLSSLGLPDQFVTQGTPAQLKHLAGIDSEAILSKIKEVTSDKDNAV